MNRRISHLISLAALALAPAVLASDTNILTFVLPPEAEKSFGNGGMQTRLIYGGGYDEQIYAASEFAGLPTDLVLITEVAFRPEESSLRPLDVIVHGPIDLRMNTFPGSMQDAVERKSGVMDPVTTVYHGENVHFAARLGQVDEFDICIHLQSPFLYDRRRGHLVLSEYVGDRGYEGFATRIDAHGTGTFDPGGFDRGAYMAPQYMAPPLPVPVTIVTKFSFKPVAAFIESVRPGTSVLQIDLTVSGRPDSIEVEGAAEVAGPYVKETDAEVTDLGENRVRAVIAAGGKRRFFRLRLR